MKTNRKIQTTFALLACASGLAGAPRASAASIDYRINVNTAPLVGNASGPFSLDFQLNDGSGTGDGNNSAKLSNFQFGGGNAFGAANLIGGATGDLTSGVSLIDTDPLLNEFFQTFVPGSTLEFDLHLTLNSDAGLTPDAFSFSILDQNLLNIPTTGLGDSLLFINVSSGTPIPEKGASTNPAGVIASVPDVSNPFVTMALAVFGLAGFRFHSRNHALKI